MDRAQQLELVDQISEQLYSQIEVMKKNPETIRENPEFVFRYRLYNDLVCFGVEDKYAYSIATTMQVDLDEGVDQEVVQRLVDLYADAIADLYNRYNTGEEQDQLILDSLIAGTNVSFTLS